MNATWTVTQVAGNMVNQGVLSSRITAHQRAINTLVNEADSSVILMTDIDLSLKCEN